MSGCSLSFDKTKQNWWPKELPEGSLDYSLDITDSIDPAVDFVQSATVAVAPSGTGELIASGFVISTPMIDGLQHTILTVTLTGGQPRRKYITKFLVTMVDGRVFPFLVYLIIPSVLEGRLLTVPPSADFSSPISSTFTPDPANYLVITNAALNQATVDGLLIALAALTPVYTGHVINLAQIGSATPSAPGLAAKATLIAAANTVLTN